MNTSKRIVFSNGEELKDLRPVLDCWFNVLDEYAERANPDLPWWYAERSQVGFLALAAWRAGGVALEEWATEKGPDQERRRGRNDLWIRLRNREFFIEAKYSWVHFYDGLEKCAAELKATLEDACSSAKELRAEPKVAAAFISLYWNPEKARKRLIQLDQVLAEWEAVCKTVGSDIVALALDTVHSEKRGFDPSTKDQSVGLAMLLKACPVCLPSSLPEPI